MKNTMRCPKCGSEKIIRVRLREFEYILSSENGPSSDGTDLGTHFHDRYV